MIKDVKSKREYKLNCFNCDNEIPFKKNVFLIEINGDFLMDELTETEFTFCSKNCASKWLDKNTKFIFLNEEDFE